MATNDPDTFGLVEYFITDVHTEIDGDNIRMVCGVRRCGGIHWLYSVVMPAKLALVSSRKVERVACEMSHAGLVIEGMTSH